MLCPVMHYALAMRATTRRDFIVRGGHAACGAALFSSARMLAAHETGDATWRALTTHLEAQIPVLMTELVVPGVSVALIRDGAIAWRRAFGVKDASTKQPVDTETIFEAASMSKPVFAYAVLKLCEKEVLELHTPLVTYGAPPVLDGDPRVKLGWQLVRTDRGVIIQHGGDNRGFHAFAVASTEHRFGAVVMTNGENGATLIGRFLIDAVERLRVAAQH